VIDAALIASGFRNERLDKVVDLVVAPILIIVDIRFLVMALA
jgi:hypothetical protein